MRTWPAEVPLADHEAVHPACGACAATFRVHEHLGGHRMRCRDCGAWMDVPRPARPSRLELQVARIAGLPHGRAVAPRRITARPPSPPATITPRAEVRAKRRAVDRGAWVEVALFAAAIATPFVVAQQFLAADARAVLAPFAALVGAVGVLLVGHSSGRGADLGLRAPRRPWAHFLEAAFVAGGLFAACRLLSVALVAEGWPPLLDPRRTDLGGALGPLAALGAFALAPAVLGELAFRGLLQGRLRTLCGGGAAVLLTAVAFALAHGLGPASPVHLALGLHLGWLRARSGSVLPGMFGHLLFAAATTHMG